jgi:hypothetical protein
MPRSFLIFATLVPLAIIMGVMIATPLDSTSLAILGGCLLMLMMPFFLRYHHAVLLVTANASLTAFFLPGQPGFWMVFAGLSLFFSILAKTLNRSSVQLYWVNAVALPLILFGLIVIVTGKLTGGVGAKVFGSGVYGARRYVTIGAAIVIFFSLCFKAIDPEKRQRLGGWFFLSGVSSFVGTLAYWMGPAFYFLFILFPADWVWQQAYTEQSITAGVTRITGLSPAMWSLTWFLLFRYGLKALLNFKRPLIGLLFIAGTSAGLLSGFRAYILLLALVCICQFFVEGLHRTKYLPISIVALLVMACVIVPLSERLPLAIQRSLTVLPLDLDPVARADAKASWDWRWEMWKVAVLDIPKYFWIGKGYAINPTDMFLTGESVLRGMNASYEGSLVAGDYHNGPLSVQLPFGIFGSITFLWFLVGGLWVLRRNFRYGDPEIKNINTFLYAYFIARAVYFMVLFGALFQDLAIFTGTVGLSIAMNRGVRSERSLVMEQEEKWEEAEEVEADATQPEYAPA